MYVTLTTLAQGRFSDNTFPLFSATYLSDSNCATPNLGPAVSTETITRVLKFIPWGQLDMSLLQSSLRVEDLSLYAN